MKLSTKAIPGKRVVIDGKPTVIVPQGVSGERITWRPNPSMIYTQKKKDK